MLLSGGPELPRVIDTNPVLGTSGREGIFFWPGRDYAGYWRRVEMKITDILDEASIIQDLRSTSKKGVLEELSSVLVEGGKLPDRDKAVQVLLEREKLGSTGIGDGIAIPHGKMKEIKELVTSFGRSIEGVDFESIDNKPTYLFFLLVAPENSAGIHLKALARISRLLKDPSFRNRLMEARDRGDLFRIIAEEDEKF
jgi:PTS system nitrogen regulatory IIA component